MKYVDDQDPSTGTAPGYQAPPGSQTADQSPYQTTTTPQPSQTTEQTPTSPGLTIWLNVPSPPGSDAPYPGQYQPSGYDVTPYGNAPSYYATPAPSAYTTTAGAPQAPMMPPTSTPAPAPYNPPPEPSYSSEDVGQWFDTSGEGGARLPVALVLGNPFLDVFSLVTAPRNLDPEAVVVFPLWAVFCLVTAPRNVDPGAVVMVFPATVAFLPLALQRWFWTCTHSSCSPSLVSYPRPSIQ